MFAKHPADDPELNIHVKEIFAAIEGSSIGIDSEDDFKGLFDDVDVRATSLARICPNATRLTKIIEGICDLDFGRVQDADIDLFVDASEQFSLVGNKNTELYLFSSMADGEADPDSDIDFIHGTTDDDMCVRRTTNFRKALRKTLVGTDMRSLLNSSASSAFSIVSMHSPRR